MKKLGWLSSTFLLLCGIPELYLGIKTDEVGASWGLLAMWFLGEVFGLIYVFPTRKGPLILNYLGNTLIVGAIIAIKGQLI